MRIVLSFLFILVVAQASAQTITGEAILDKMYARYGGKWHKSVSFIKEVQQYPGGKKADQKQYWFETILYPGRMRMDIGDVTNGNMIILANDSLYKYQDGKNVYANRDRGDYFMLIGDMYFMPLETLKYKLRGFSYDLSKGTETTWKGKPIYVIGANDTTERANQLWVEKERLILLRSIEVDGGVKNDIVFENHVKLPTSWLETKVSFLADDKLLQEEIYHSYSTERTISPDLFSPIKAFKAKHWYEPAKP